MRDMDYVRDFMMALNIFEEKGLYGECLRIASRLGDDVLIRMYKEKVRQRWRS